jgi:two-component system, OmpR family, sensor histidine kinase PhoQ
MHAPTPKAVSASVTATHPWLTRLATGSLRIRLFLASLVLLPILLGFSATTLDYAFRLSLETAERDALRSQIYMLLGVAEPGHRSLEIPPVLAEPRFGELQSGLYAWLVDGLNQLAWQSRSADLIPVGVLPGFQHAFSAGYRHFAKQSFNGDDFFVMSYDTVWQISGREQSYRFIVAHSQKDYKKVLSAYRERLVLWVLGLAGLLMVVQSLIAHWGLSPLRQLAQDLELVEAGASQGLTGLYPDDIRPVIDNLNKVLKTELALRERYRNTLSDLAHSLKTPLAVVRGQLAQPELKPEAGLHLIDDQISRMGMIIDHQLRRASAQVTQNAARRPLELLPVLQRLATALQKVYAYKRIEIQISVPESLQLTADEADLMEVAGNIMENACKYGLGRVAISSRTEASEWVLEIADDGPGVPELLRQAILERGARADTATSGQGIGLAVVVDILSSYGGGLTIGTSTWGGACFRVTLPLSLKN